MAIDGTWILANACRHKSMSDERVQQAETGFKAQRDALLDHASTVEAAELDVDFLAEIECCEHRINAIAEARERIEKRQRDADIEHDRSPDDVCKP